MKSTTIIGLCACTISLLALPLVAADPAEAATAGHKSEPAAGRSHEASKPAPKGQDKAEPQPDVRTGVPAPANATPSNKTQIVEERLRQGDLDEAGAQGQISDRLDQFYEGSERLPGRQAAGPPDR